DVQAPAPGENSHWRPDWRSYLNDAPFDPWLAGLMAASLGTLVVFIYLRERKVVRGARSAERGAQEAEGVPRSAHRAPRSGGLGWLLMSCFLRIGLFLLMLTVFMPQFRVLFERQSWPDVVILIDDSASMGTVDDYRDPDVREAADKLASVASLSRK